MKDPREMTSGELQEWLGDRLRMRGLASADIDLRRDEAPYERPLALWKSSHASFHNDFLRAVVLLLEKAAAAPWDAQSFDQLLRLIEAGRIREAAGALEDLAHSRVLLANEKTEQLHMQVLRTLVALGWIGSPEFWFAQQVMIGARWPGLIFKGLARHDLKIAFAQLPSLAADPKAMRQILDLIPGLMRDQSLSISTIRDASLRVLPNIPAASANLLREWFSLRDIHLAGRFTIVHVSLSNALVEELGDEFVPRTYDAALVAPEIREVACA